MKDDKIDNLIRQRKNKYFRDYYKNNKEAVLKAQRKYWERKLKEEQKGYLVKKQSIKK